MTISIKLFFLALFIAIFHVGQGRADELNFASIDNLSEQQVGQLVLPKIYQTLAKQINITPLPGKRAQIEANSGIKDGEIMRIFSYGLETPNVIRVPTPYYYLTTAVFTRADSYIIINNKDDLANYRIGKVRGVKHTENATKGLVRVYNSTNTHQLFKQLQQGTIDIAITNHLNGVRAISAFDKNTFKVVNQSIAFEPLYHYIHKKHSELVEPVDNAIKKLTASGELAHIVKAAEKIVYQ